MRRKKRSYNLRLIKGDYTYSLDQIADLFGIDVATVRRWIKFEGLERIPKTRPFLVHSSALKAFMDKKRKARKQACGECDAWCCKCKRPCAPKSNTGTIHNQPNGTVRFQGQCATCGTRINRVLKGVEWSEKHPLAAYLHDAAKQHNGAQSSHRECQFQKGDQLCLNITP